MSNDLTIPGLVGGPSTRYQERPVEETIGSNIGGLGYSVIGPTQDKHFKLQHNGSAYTLPAQGSETYIDIIILRGGDKPSKTWYKQGYRSDQTKPPDCQSTDGIGPDDAVLQPQTAVAGVEPLCQLCPKHQWVKNNPENNGRDGRACHDSLRLAVFPASQQLIEQATGEKIQEPLLFRVPAASMKGLKQFLDGVQGKHGKIASFSYVTRVSMRQDVPYSAFTYRVSKWLDDSMVDQLEVIAEEPLAKRIMGLTPEGHSLVRQAANQPQQHVVDILHPAHPTNAIADRLAAERQERIAAVRAAGQVQTIDAKGEDIAMIDDTAPTGLGAGSSANGPQKPITKLVRHPVAEAPPDMATLIAAMRPRPPQT